MDKRVEIGMGIGIPVTLGSDQQGRFRWRGLWKLEPHVLRLNQAAPGKVDCIRLQLCVTRRKCALPSVCPVFVLVCVVFDRFYLRVQINELGAMRVQQGRKNRLNLRPAAVAASCTGDVISGLKRTIAG